MQYVLLESRCAEWLGNDLNAAIPEEALKVAESLPEGVIADSIGGI